MDMRERFISVIIPSRNSEATLEECLRAAFASSYGVYEVVVVDDASSDGSPEIMRRYPCRVLRLHEQAGVSRARNLGAEHSKGEVILFIDSDCLLQENSLAIVNESFDAGAKVLGGSYTPIPWDKHSFFSTFQSVFVNYHETVGEPDYVAAHCMAIDKALFQEIGGFIEDSYIGFEAGVEDVELSHRLRRAGYELRMRPDLLVRHVFNFTLWRSLKNAYKKSKLWTMYSLNNKDLMKSSGTASTGLKLNVAVYFTSLYLGLAALFFGPLLPAPLPILIALNIYYNIGLLMAFYRAKDAVFALKAAAYYFLVYPVAVGAGALAGALNYLARLIK